MSKKPEVHQLPSFWERNRRSHGYLLRKEARSKAYKLFRFLLLFAICFLILHPILDKLSVSLMEERDLYDSSITSIPRHVTLDNYRITSEQIYYPQALVNTLWIAALVSVLQVAACTLVAYGFARFQFPLKKLWFAAVVLVIIVPPQTISTSLYLRFRYFDILGLFQLFTGKTQNLRGSSIPYYLMSITCMGLKDGLYIYMLRQFFASVPVSLEEAAYVDGCSVFRTFWQVILPEAFPIIVSCLLFAFVWQWTDTFYSRLFLGGNTLLSMQVSGIADRIGNYFSTQLGIATSLGRRQQFVSTATLMVIAPLLLIYLFAQKSFVESISTSGMKM